MENMHTMDIISTMISSCIQKKKQQETLLLKCSFLLAARKKNYHTGDNFKPHPSNKWKKTNQK